jgi:hypothetical protein
VDKLLGLQLPEGVTTDGPALGHVRQKESRWPWPTAIQAAAANVPSGMRSWLKGKHLRDQVHRWQGWPNAIERLEKEA